MINVKNEEVIVVKNILELHEADYGVESEDGKGSTFWFELAYKEILES